jgi:histidinol dehydrogenase
VPGGKAVYPSSVIMNVVPAQTAGVRSLAIATPPSREGDDGLPSKTILATCAILGVTEVYAVGGAQAIAMFAYGARGSEPQDGEILCDPVDKITGPGNIFVATAKSMVSGMVGIDAVAGPTEIAILADKDANPSWVAADLIGQAEHDELAGSVLITDSDELAAAVQKASSTTACRAPNTPSAWRPR